MAKLDEIDMKILSALNRDASISIPKLSNDLGINLSVAYSRIKRLIRRGIIEHYTITVNEDKLGMTASAIAGINLDPKNREQILDEIMKMDSVRLLREVTGRFDLIVNFRGASLDELHKSVLARTLLKEYKPVDGWPSEHIPSRVPAAVAKWSELRDLAGLRSPGPDR